MRRNVSAPRREYPGPRRFRSHREAAAWACRSVARFVLRRFPNLLATFAVFEVLHVLLPRYPAVSWPPYSVFLASAMASAVLILGVLASALLYLYTVLAGGVMSREERAGRFR